MSDTCETNYIDCVKNEGRDCYYSAQKCFEGECGKRCEHAKRSVEYISAEIKTRVAIIESYKNMINEMTQSPEASHCESLRDLFEFHPVIDYCKPYISGLEKIRNDLNDEKELLNGNLQFQKNLENAKLKYCGDTVSDCVTDKTTKMMESLAGNERTSKKWFEESYSQPCAGHNFDEIPCVDDYDERMGYIDKCIEYRRENFPRQNDMDNDSLIFEPDFWGMCEAECPTYCLLKSREQYSASKTLSNIRDKSKPKKMTMVVVFREGEYR